MITDSYLTFAEKLAVTASATLPYVIDAEHLTGGKPIYAVFHNNAAGTGTGTVTYQVVGADSADLATNPEVVAQTGALTANTLNAGDATAVGIGFSIPAGNRGPGRRFYGVKAVVNGTVNLTVSAYLVETLAGWKVAPIASVIK